MLLTCSSLLLFHQIIEDPNCLSPEKSHFDHNLSRRHAVNWKGSPECSDVLRCSDLPIAATGICDKTKRVVDYHLTGDGVSEDSNKLQRIEHLSSRKKPQKLKLQCLYLYQSPQASILQLKKVLGHLTSTIQVFLSAQLNTCFLLSFKP